MWPDFYAISSTLFSKKSALGAASETGRMTHRTIIVVKGPGQHLGVEFRSHKLIFPQLKLLKLGKIDLTQLKLVPFKLGCIWLDPLKQQKRQKDCLLIVSIKATKTLRKNWNNLGVVKNWNNRQSCFVILVETNETPFWSVILGNKENGARRLQFRRWNCFSFPIIQLNIQG